MLDVQISVSKSNTKHFSWLVNRGEIFISRELLFALTNIS